MKRLLLFLAAGIFSLPLWAQSSIQIGKASAYPGEKDGSLTSSGEVLSQDRYTAAHASLPMNAMIRVTHLLNNQTINLRINDRRPYDNDHVLTLTQAAAKKLGLTAKESAYVKLETLNGEAIPQATADSAGNPGSIFFPPGLFHISVHPTYEESYGVQIGLFSEVSNLHRQLQEIRFVWPDDALIYIEQTQGTTRFKLIIGPFDARYKAEAFKNNLPGLLQDKNARGFIVKLSDL